MAKRQAARSRAFFLELVLNLVIFVFCAAICLQVFATGYESSRHSSDLSHLSITCETIAEEFKAAGGDLGAVAAAYGAPAPDESGTCRVYFNAEYVLTADTSAPYMIECVATGEGTVRDASITAYRSTGHEQIFSLTVAAIVTGGA
jgi:hypothetical protein